MVICNSPKLGRVVTTMGEIGNDATAVNAELRRANIIVKEATAIEIVEVEGAKVYSITLPDGAIEAYAVFPVGKAGEVDGKRS